MQGVRALNDDTVNRFEAFPVRGGIFELFRRTQLVSLMENRQFSTRLEAAGVDVAHQTLAGPRIGRRGRRDRRAQRARHRATGGKQSAGDACERDARWNF